MVAMSPLATLPGAYGARLLVTVYVGVSIATELDPSRFLAAMGDKDDSATVSRAPRALPSASKPRPFRRERQ